MATMAHMSICKIYREKCSYVTRFTVSELLTILFLLLGTSVITFFEVPLFFEHPEPDWTAIFDAVTRFWEDNTRCGADITSAILGSVSFPVALFALVVFRHSDAANRLEAFNDRQKENSIRIGVVILVLLLQTFLTIEFPHLTDELGRAPACILALMILAFNVFVSLSILDYAELLTINGKTAEEKLDRYEKWLRKTTGRESGHPLFARPLLRAMLAPFLLYMARFLLSYASPIWTADARLPQKIELTLIVLAVAVPYALIASSLQTVLLAQPYIDAESRGERISRDAIVMLIVPVLLQFLVNIAMLVCYFSWPLLFLQFLAMLLTAANVYCAVRCHPVGLLKRIRSSWLDPYLIRTCEGAIAEQERIIRAVREISTGVPRMKSPYRRAVRRPAPGGQRRRRNG